MCKKTKFELAEFDCIVIKTAGIQALCVVHVPVNEGVCHIFVTKKNKKTRKQSDKVCYVIEACHTMRFDWDI